MSHRLSHLPYYCLLIGFLMMSVGYNIILWNRLDKLINKNNSTWVSDQEIQIITKEIERLEKESNNLTR